MASYSNNMNAEEAATKIENLKRLERALHSASTFMTSQVEYEDIAIFIGSTRSGKSCLINYLMGNKLEGVKLVACKPVSIKKTDASPGPAIGAGPTSETIIPTKWNSQKLPGLGIWDAPGFQDNRGSVQDITNAFYIYELLRNVKSVKFVLVTDINDISNDNIKPFLSLLNAVENLLKKRMQDCFSSIAIIFTKVPNTLNDYPVDMDFINNLLKEQFLSSTAIEMSQPAKDFVRYLISNNRNIGFFKRATTGPITAAIDEGVFQAIKNTHYVGKEVLSQVFPSISVDSTVFLYEIRENLSSMEVFEALQNVVRDVLGKKLGDYGTIGQDVSVDNLKIIDGKLSTIRHQIEKNLDHTIGFHKKVEVLQIIDPAIESYIRKHDLLEKSNLMEFVDKLLDLKESNHFHFNLQGIMLTAMSTVEKLIISVHLELGEISKKEANAQLIQSQENHQREIEKLKIEVENVKQHNKKKRNFFQGMLRGIRRLIGF